MCIHNRKSKQDKNSYRQICVVDPISIAMECIVNSQLLEYLVENKFIPDEQYAFRPGTDVGINACLNTTIATWIKTEKTTRSQS